jgi:hypothetical protein
VGNYDLLANKKRELIRKGLKGSVFLADLDADSIDDLTTGVTPNIELAPLPDGYDDLGWLTTEGAAFARAVAQADISSWGSNTPTRTDITSDISSLTVAMQETKLLTIGLGTGADLASLVPDPTTGELRIDKPATPDSKSYRVLTVAVDAYQGEEIYIGRYLPSAKVTNYAEQALGGGDEGIGWGVTFTGEEDSDLGFSESWIFGGQGWFNLLDKMGFSGFDAS